MNAQLTASLFSFVQPQILNDQVHSSSPVAQPQATVSQVARPGRVFRLRGGYAGENLRAVALNRSIRGRYA